MPLCEGSQHYVQQVLVEGLERDLRLFREISAQAGLSASASGLGLVLEFEAKIRAAKGEVQLEALALMAGDKSQLEMCAWPLLRAERAAGVVKGAARLAELGKNGGAECEGRAQPAPSDAAVREGKEQEAKQITGEARADVRVASPSCVDSAGRRLKLITVEARTDVRSYWPMRSITPGKPARG